MRDGKTQEVPRDKESYQVGKNSEILFDANVLILPIILLSQTFPGFYSTSPAISLIEPLLPPSFRLSIDRAGNKKKYSNTSRYATPLMPLQMLFSLTPHSFFFTSSAILVSETYSGPPKIHHFPLTSGQVGQCVFPWTSGGGIAGLSFRMRKSCKICFAPTDDF